MRDPGATGHCFQERSTVPVAGFEETRQSEANFRKKDEVESMNHWKLGLFAIWLSVGSAPAGLAQGTDTEGFTEDGVARTLEAYQYGKKGLSFRTRYARAVTQVRSATDEAVIGRAIRDLLEMSRPLENTDEALDVMDGFVRRNNVDTGQSIVRKAWLVRARMLLRQGVPTAADALFRTAIEGKWSAPDTSHNRMAFRYYAEGLDEVGRYGDAAILEYEVMTGPHNPVPDAEWNMMSHLFYRLWNLTWKEPHASAVQDVYPRIAEIPEVPGHPEYRRIAEAFCLMADERHSEAVALLQEIDKGLAEREGSTDEKTYGEVRNIPLYIATAHFLDGEDLDAACAGLDEFWRRNKDRPLFVFNMTGLITHRLGRFYNDPKNRRLCVTEFMVEKGFISDPKKRAHIPGKEIAHFLTKHAYALRKAGRTEESKAVCLEAVERYFPHNLGGVTGLAIYAEIAWIVEKDYEVARASFQRIIDECDDTVSDDVSPNSLRNAQQDLIDVLVLLGRPRQEILPHLYELRDMTAREHKHHVDNKEVRIMRMP